MTMQPLTGAPWRSQFTAAQIVSLLTGPTVECAYYLDLMDQNNNLIADISDNLVSWSLTRSNTATVQGTGSFVITQEIQGGSQRVRPWMTLTGDDGTHTGTTITARWDLGVYVLVTPAAAVNEVPLTYTIDGYDLLYLLQNQIGDTYTVAAGVGYLNAVATVIQAAGVQGSQILLDQSAAALLVPTALVWPLTGTTTSYLDVANQLLASIAYLPLWADWDGNFRSGPYAPPLRLAPEFTMDLTLKTNVVVSDPRTLTNDLWQFPNWWRYLNSSVSAPTEGAGQYTFINQSSGKSSVDAVGRQIRNVVTVSAPDQTTLVGIATQQITQSMQLLQSLAVSVSPFPASWHYDMFTYKDLLMPDGQTNVVVQSQGWSLASDGSDGAQTWQVV